MKIENSRTYALIKAGEKLRLNGGKEYTVRKGDSLYSIIRKFPNESLSSICLRNNIKLETLPLIKRENKKKVFIPRVKSEDRRYYALIKVGQKLRLRDNKIYTVKKGDSLYSIIRKFPDESLKSLAFRNNIELKKSSLVLKKEKSKKVFTLKDKEDKPLRERSRIRVNKKIRIIEKKEENGALIKNEEIKEKYFNSTYNFGIYRGKIKNDSGVTSISPNDKSSFFGKGKLNYQIINNSLSLDHYGKRPYFLTLSHKKTSFNQKGESSSYKTDLEDVDFKAKTAFGKYGEPFNFSPYVSFGLTKNNTFTVLPPLGKYDSTTKSASIGFDVLTLPHIIENKWYREEFTPLSLNSSFLISREHGDPEFVLKTNGYTLGVSQTWLKKSFPINASFNHSKSKSHSSSSLWGESDYKYMENSLALNLKPLSKIENLPSSLKNTSFEAKKTWSESSFLDSGKSSKAESERYTTRTPIYTFDSGVLTLGLRHTRNHIDNNTNKTNAASVEFEFYF